MKLKWKKIISSLICFALVAAIIPSSIRTAYAQSSDAVGIAQVSCGGDHTGILKKDGSLWMTGYNDWGQLGDDTIEQTSTPVRVFDDVVQISCGSEHTGIVKKDGSLWMTGDNRYGQLGDGTTWCKTTPVKIMDGVAQVSCGDYHTGILKKDGSLWMTGFNRYNQLGDGTILESRLTPVKIMDDVAHVSCGGTCTGIIKKDGSLWMTSDIVRSDGDYTTPGKAMDNVAHVSCGGEHIGILKTDGSLWMVGGNSAGELGDGTLEYRHTPVKIMDNVEQISCGSHHTGILKKDGSLWMTGANWSGQLGVGTSEYWRNYPVKIMGDVAQVICGWDHTSILKKDGSLWMTGYNDLGQLGDGTNVSKDTPVIIDIGDSGGSQGTQVILDKSSTYLAIGKTLTLKASGPSDITFKTSKKSIATVTSKGVVKAVKPGTATITAYSKSDKSNKAVCKVTVKYRLTYKMNGGKNSAKNPEWYTGTVKLTNPQTRKGWDFKGWYSDSKYKNKVKSVKNANKTLYAKWDWHSYYIKYLKNGGSGDQYFQTCRYDKTFNLLACKYTRNGYSFAGWNTKADGSGKAYADRASFKSLTSVDGKTVPLYAQWKLDKYSINYKGLPSGAKNTNKTSYTINTATFSLKNASCAGYDFKGWFSDSKKTKKLPSIAKGSTGNKTIYSKWSPHKYTIRFDVNGGTGSMNSMSCVYGKQYNLTANTLKMEKYVFTGWNTKADGSGTAYADGAAVNNLTTKNGGSITLYAQWKPAFIPRVKLEGLNRECLDRAIGILDVRLPNCTTYALARAFEITNNDPKLSSNGCPPFIVPGHSDAALWWDNNMNSDNPYPTGRDPREGAIAVWSNGGAGHVAIVEHISSDGVVYYSHSNYGGFTWNAFEPYPGSVNTNTFHCEAREVNGEVKWGTDLTLLGYIYLED